MDKVQKPSNSEGTELFVHKKILPTVERVDFIIHGKHYVNITKRSLVDVIALEVRFLRINVKIQRIIVFDG
jgi:hypothetical protein